MSSHTVSINDFEMYYELCGSGHPLLILHGFTGSGAALLEGFQSLSAEYQLIIPDLRGHGRSTNPAKQFSLKQAAEDVIALLSWLKIDKCVALGFSVGGCILLQMAYQLPALIQSMTIVSAVPYFPEKTKEIMKQFSTQEKTAAEWQAMRQIHVHGDEQIQLLWQEAGELSDDDMNLTPSQLAQITAETLIVQGDRDHLYPIELTVELYKHLANAYLWIIPNGGHVPVSRESTPDFVAHLQKFYKNVKK